MSRGAELVEKALSLSTADGCVVIVRESTEVTLRWAGNTLTTNGSTEGRSVSVISIVGASVGARSASVVDDTELAELVGAAEAAARSAPAAEDAGPLIEGSGLESFTDPAEVTTIAVFDTFATDLGESFKAARSDGLLLYGFASHDITTTWLGSSTGLRKRHVQPTGYVEVTGKNDRRGGSSWWGQSSRDMTDLSVPVIDAELRRRLSWTERFVELPAGRYDTVLPPTAVADFLVYGYWSSAGRDAAEGRSAYSRSGGRTRIGEALAASGTRLWSDPAASGIGVEPFVCASASSAITSVFDNGLDLPATSWIEDGKLASLIETRATAARSDEVAVTPFVDNLLFDTGGTGSTDDLVTGVERGLLLTCLWYIRELDPESLLLTGLTRDGVYLIEGGEITGVVNNFRYNESPLDLLGRIAGSSASERTLPREWSDFFHWARMPAIRIPDFRMSSVSPAT